MAMQQPVFVVACIALISVAGAVGCNRKPPVAVQQTSVAAVKVSTAGVEVRTAQRTIAVTGTLFGEEEVEIAAEVPGRIVSLRADLGDVVEHGAQIGEIDPTNYLLEVQEAEATYKAALSRLGLTELTNKEVDISTLPIVVRAEAQAENAVARFDRARKLYDRSPPLISEQDFADIATQNEVAKAEVKSERLNALALVADARVKAAALLRAQQRLADTKPEVPKEKPLRYRVALRHVSVGEVVAQNSPLFRLVATDRIKARASVPERFAPQINIGADAQIIVEQSTNPVIGKVTRVSPSVDVATRTFEVEIEADNSAGLLKPGGFFRAQVLTSVEPDAKYVPAAAVVQFAGVHRVFSVKDGKAVEHRVRPVQSVGEFTEVAGLDAKTTSVIAKPPPGLVSGASVTIEPDKAR